ncbi:NAD(P)-binding domain-containing protein [Ammoniphilus resinae]|uniref:3-hydroxyisobutyrate dehydrogenase-like beta-hydroxyacid dehydrogenase n=1 Tax=Ammoniphilus resinae TaxID=861532 RepID=A0ABS4GIZ8_9BACL|nr:NAD(P)-binding domain-containing protein [Ammoniphilus resinae]MBP1930199.1 3-hydroxyisobutyrate dehydrogenase-like beta-hydroxyacid dehydrogenase [Ammoniphilus resinae]
MDNTYPKVGLIGFGEVGQAFAKGLVEKTNQVWAYDIVFETPNHPLAVKAREMGVQPTQQLEEIGAHCSLILTLVNSSSSETVAQNIAPALSSRTIYLDLTTSTPQMKARSEQFISSYAGMYVDASIMGTVATEQHRVPLLIAGANGEKVKFQLDRLGFNATVIDQPNGAAASIKLLRSIFMKGLEALVIETMLTAENYKVSDEVMKSIANTLNHNDFTQFANTLITTHVLHKKRRHKEVQDSYSLITEANLEPHVTQGVLSFFGESVKKEINMDHLRLSKEEAVKDILHQYLLQK